MIAMDGIVEDPENFNGVLEVDAGTPRVTVDPAMAIVTIEDSDSKDAPVISIGTHVYVPRFSKWPTCLFLAFGTYVLPNVVLDVIL